MATATFFDWEKSEILNVLKNQKKAKAEIISLIALSVIGGGILIANPEPASAQTAAPADVTTMVSQTIATAQALGGLAIGIFAVGLTPWGARMALHWLGTIMRGSI